MTEATLSGRWEARKADPKDYGTLTYDDLIDTMGVTRVSRERFGDYEGEYVYVVERDGVRGILVVGFGSCSGCDALGAAIGYNDDYTPDVASNVEALRDQLRAGILWPAGVTTLAQRVEEKITADPYWAHEGGIVEYIRKVAQTA